MASIGGGKKLYKTPVTAIGISYDVYEALVRANILNIATMLKFTPAGLDVVCRHANPGGWGPVKINNVRSALLKNGLVLANNNLAVPFRFFEATLELKSPAERKAWSNLKPFGSDATVEAFVSAPFAKFIDTTRYNRDEIIALANLVDRIDDQLDKFGLQRQRITGYAYKTSHPLTMLVLPKKIRAHLLTDGRFLTIADLILNSGNLMTVNGMSKADVLTIRSELVSYNL